MKKHLMSGLIAAIAIVAPLAVVPLTQAGTTTDSISIHFGADEPTEVSGSMLAPTDVTGVVPSANWNNVTTNAGTAAVMEDKNGVASQSGAQVTWYASNTWSSAGKGQENNNFKGADHTLMSGYLDMEVGNAAVTFIQINNLPASFSGTYDVYIYTLPGVAGRGGIYQCNSNQNRGFGTNGNYAYVVTSGPKDPTNNNNGLFSGPTFQQVIGDDPLYGSDAVNTDDFGNYVLFMGVTGPSVNITAVSQNLGQFGTGYDGTPRAAINGVQIVVD
jgi:hypothetical protein